jgi:hypothetical protein
MQTRKNGEKREDEEGKKEKSKYKRERKEDPQYFIKIILSKRLW